MASWIQNNLFLLSCVVALFVFFSLLFSIISLLKVRNLRNTLKSFLLGKKGADLEEIIMKQAKEIKGLDKEIHDLYEISNKINQLAHRSLHKVGIIRFNPFKDIGGDQSFAISLLDGKNCGFILSSLHTREGTRVYTKPITHRESAKYPLTEEEKQAIKIASPLKAAKL